MTENIFEKYVFDVYFAFLVFVHVPSTNMEGTEFMNYANATFLELECLAL